MAQTKKTSTTERKSPKREIQKKKIDNGPIYPPIVCERAEHPEDMAQVFRNAVREADADNDLQANLNRIEAHLRQTLEPYILKPETLSKLGLDDESLERSSDPKRTRLYSVPKDAPRLARDAKQAFDYLNLMKLHRSSAPTNADVDLSIMNAIWLGTYLDRMKVRPFEPAVVTGKKIQNATSKGGRTRAGSNEQRNAENNRWRKEINKLRGANRKISRMGACKIIATGERVQYRTIWNRVGKNLAK